MTIAKTRQNLLKIANGCQKISNGGQSLNRMAKLHDDCKNSPKFAQNCQRMSKISNGGQSLNRMAKNFMTIAKTRQNLPKKGPKLPKKRQEFQTVDKG